MEGPKYLSLLDVERCRDSAHAVSNVDPASWPTTVPRSPLFFQRMRSIDRERAFGVGGNTSPAPQAKPK